MKAKKSPGERANAAKPFRLKTVAAQAALPRWKRWCFRLLAAGVGPVVLLALIEVCLRLVGAGYPTSFLLPFENDGQKYWIQNNKFGWRFFGRQMAREPHPLFFSQAKPPGATRIFVFGESAAYGDPQPAYGLPRMLRALLELRYPQRRFEVINAAMTGINSHAILPIARDCSAAGGDIWVIYMGNNEVVGPYGAGTVFGRQSPPLPLIRASLWLKTLRLSQVLEPLLNRGAADREWHGMAMFLEQRVTATDPRLEIVYRHFQSNLEDLIRTGLRGNARIVLSTVGVNLKDCPPFASAHRAKDPGLAWTNAWQRGLRAREAGNASEALACFRTAASLDDGFAELRFALGQSELAAASPADGSRDFEAARDLDTLRFRADARLNAAIRKIAGRQDPQRVLLADTELGLGKQAAGGIPGQDFFYDHVHLTFEGNYLAAREIASQIEKLFPPEAAGSAVAAAAWPTLQACAERLAWSDFARRAALLEMVSRISAPPFTAQLDHAARLQQISQSLTRLGPESAGVPQAILACEAAVRTHPEDEVVWMQAATLEEASGQPDKAVAAARKLVELTPANSEAWERLGSALESQKQLDAAAAAFRQAIARDNLSSRALDRLAGVLARKGRIDEAMATFRRVLELKPRFGPAWLSLGQLLEKSGKFSEALPCYQAALTNRVNNLPELNRLAAFCLARGWRLAAATNLADAVRLNPADVPSWLQAGKAYVAAGRPAEAEPFFREAVRLAPDYGPARFLYGEALGRAGRPFEAEQQFRKAAVLLPDLPEARLNLALSFVNQNRIGEALAEYQTVLQHWPTNETALEMVKRLAPGLGPVR